MAKIKKRSGCPISSALDLVGDKWSLLIVRDILLVGKNTYNEFLASEEKIATNILADRLAMLEEVGILSKETHPESKAKFFYKLTQQGIDLLPILVEIILWSDKYLAISPQAREFAKQLRKGKDGIVREISNRLGKSQTK
jgi:DNA-binding HxlR family transcriptional regulator